MKTTSISTSLEEKDGIVKIVVAETRDKEADLGV